MKCFEIHSLFMNLKMVCPVKKRSVYWLLYCTGKRTSVLSFILLMKLTSLCAKRLIRPHIVWHQDGHFLIIKCAQEIDSWARDGKRGDKSNVICWNEAATLLQKCIGVINVYHAMKELV